MNKSILEIYRRPHRLVLPELVSLGRYETTESHLGGARPDEHDGLEIGYLESGSVEWWDGEAIDEARPGSVLVDRPGTWQGGKSAIVHPCVRYWLRFEFPFTCLPGMAPEIAADISSGLASISRHHFPASSRFSQLFGDLLNQQRHPDAYAEQYSRSLFQQLLVLVVREHNLVLAEKPSERMAQVTDYMRTNLHLPLAIPDIAKRFDLSAGHLHERFKREVGISPSRFVQEARIREAKRRLINTDDTVTTIALDLGFSSSHWFATSFRSLVGLTPKAYKSLRRETAARY
jgi:AraC-like DNA-binding protein